MNIRSHDIKDKKTKKSKKGINDNISYLPENNIDINDDIISRKEFNIFKMNVEQIRFVNKFKKDEEDRKNQLNSKYLELTSYQLFVQNYINPNTPYSRLLLKWSTGFGKTIGSIAIAINFIKFYGKRSIDIKEENMGFVYFIGFTRHIFKEEWIKYTEFGFITNEEITRLNILKKNAHNGSIDDIGKL